MQLYSCKVRLAGELKNEVPKVGVTAAELVVLSVLHSHEHTHQSDAVVDIKLTGEIKRTDSEERARLEGIYGRALRRIEGVGTLNGVFGVGTPLPKVAEGAIGVVKVDGKVKRTRVAVQDGDGGTAGVDPLEELAA